MSERKVLTQAVALHYQRARKADKKRILDELCATTGWHRDHARKALRSAWRPMIATTDRLRPSKYGQEVIAALVFCWSLLGMPTGKRLAPVLSELVPVLRRFGELNIDDDTARLLVAMSAATIDRRLAPERKKHELMVDDCAKLCSQFKCQIPVRARVVWSDAVPGFVEVGLVSHKGDDAADEHAWTLTVSDVATGWTEKRSGCTKTRDWVLAALDDIAITMPFPITGVDSDDGSAFIDEALHTWCARRQITFTRSWPGDTNDYCDVSQRDWAALRTLVGYHRYETAAEVLLLNKIWKLQSLLTNYFHPQQRLVSKVCTDGKVSRKHDTAATPHRRVEAYETVSAEDKAILVDTYAAINPAAVQRQIQAVTSELLTLTTGKAKPRPTTQLTWVFADESTSRGYAGALT